LYTPPYTQHSLSHVCAGSSVRTPCEHCGGEDKTDADDDGDDGNFKPPVAGADFLTPTDAGRFAPDALLAPVLCPSLFNSACTSTCAFIFFISGSSLPAAAAAAAV